MSEPPPAKQPRVSGQTLTDLQAACTQLSAAGAAKALRAVQLEMQREEENTLEEAVLGEKWTGVPRPFLSKSNAHSQMEKVLRDAKAGEHWSNKKKFTTFALDNTEVMVERHHLQYGKPWAYGRDIYDMLRSRGLTEQSRMLDIGCGALRLGVHCIRYLQPGNYFGVDSDADSVSAGREYELRLHSLEDKRSHLLVDDAFRFELFGPDLALASLDIIVAAAVHIHLSEEQTSLMVVNALRYLKPSTGQLLVSHRPLGAEALKTADLQLAWTGQFPESFDTAFIACEEWWSYSTK